MYIYIYIYIALSVCLSVCLYLCMLHKVSRNSWKSIAFPPKFIPKILIEELIFCFFLIEDIFASYFFNWGGAFFPFRLAFSDYWPTFSDYWPTFSDYRPTFSDFCPTFSSLVNDSGSSGQWNNQNSLFRLFYCLIQSYDLYSTIRILNFLGRGDKCLFP